MVGVTGSIPVAPTINPSEIRLLLDHRAGLPRLNIYASTLTSILPKFLPCSKPRNDAGAFSNPSTISSRYLRRPVRTHSPTSRKKSACFAAKSQTMNPRRSRRLRNTENMSGPGIGVVLRDEPAYGNARKIVEQRPHRLLHGAADVLEINVNALGTSGFELFCKIRPAMVDTSIEAQLAGDEAALLDAAGDPDRAASFDFGDLP